MARRKLKPQIRLRLKADQARAQNGRGAAQRARGGHLGARVARLLDTLRVPAEARLAQQRRPG